MAGMSRSVAKNREEKQKRGGEMLCKSKEMS